MQSEIDAKLNHINLLISQDNAKDAFRTLQELKTGHPEDKRIIFNEPGILIDIGDILKDGEKVVAGIHKGEILLEKDLSNEQKAHMNYNLANGYQTLFTLDKQKRLSARLNNGNLQKAKDHLRQALRLNPGPELRIRILVNYGNCLDILGRTLEALYCYDDALKTNPDYSMAIGNRALRKAFFADVSGAV